MNLNVSSNNHKSRGRLYICKVVVCSRALKLEGNYLQLFFKGLLQSAFAEANGKALADFYWRQNKLSNYKDKFAVTPSRAFLNQEN